MTKRLALAIGLATALALPLALAQTGSAPGTGPGMGPGCGAGGQAAAGCPGGGYGMGMGAGCGAAGQADVGCPGGGRGAGMGPGHGRGAGMALMTPEERTAFHAAMHSVKTVAECNALLAQHRELIEQRAQEKGVAAPPGPRGNPCERMKARGVIS